MAALLGLVRQLTQTNQQPSRKEEEELQSGFSSGQEADVESV